MIRVVLDNLNTHGFGSRFTTFGPEEGRRLQFHYTPKHASWLTMAECELSVLSRPCWNRRIAVKATLSTEVAACQEPRNRVKVRINWTFRVADARK